MSVQLLVFWLANSPADEQSSYAQCRGHCVLESRTVLTEEYAASSASHPARQRNCMRLRTGVCELYLLLAIGAAELC